MPTIHEHIQAETRQHADSERADAIRFARAMARVATTDEVQSPSADDLRTLFGPLPAPLAALKFDTPTGARLTAEQVETLLERYRDVRSSVAALAEVEADIERRGGTAQAVQAKIDDLTPGIEAEIAKLREPIVRLEGQRRMLELLENTLTGARAKVAEAQGALGLKIGNVLDFARRS